MNRRGDQVGRKICNNFKDWDRDRDREEELSFFRDLHKREKDQLACSLLQPVSEEFEANGKYGLYRMESGGRKGLGVEFLAETGKNDYNWLKTPPATPLFPSLELETNSQEQLIIQREIPILQPLSRFAGCNKEVKKPISTNYRPKLPNPNQKLPQRHKTPTGRPSISSSIHKKNMKIAPTQLHDKAKQTSSPIVKSNIIQKQNPRPNFLASNLEIKSSSNTNSKTRGVSPSLRQKDAGFPDETPPNLITVNRPSSANRGRPSNQSSSVLLQKQEITNSKIIRRQSCSPSVTRGRKFDHTQTNIKVVARGNQTVQVLGSRMVDKFMNARNSSIEERQCKMKMKSSMNITVDEERQAGKVKVES